MLMIILFRNKKYVILKSTFISSGNYLIRKQVLLGRGVDILLMITPKYSSQLGGSFFTECLLGFPNLRIVYRNNTLSRKAKSTEIVQNEGSLSHSCQTLERKNLETLKIFILIFGACGIHEIFNFTRELMRTTNVF